MAQKPQSSGLRLPMPIWDLPVRLFHWLLPILIITSYLTVKTGHMALHLLSGYTMAALLLFRLVWGVVGSDTARFTHFVKSPVAALRYVGQMSRREPDNVVGHNEAGGLMVLGLLALLVVQVATGLCANDDGETEGPLMKFISKALSDLLSKMHVVNFKLIMVAVGLHILAVVAYRVFKGHDLVRAMITGRKRLPAATPAPRMVHPVVALVILGVAAALVFVIVRVL